MKTILSLILFVLYVGIMWLGTGLAYLENQRLDKGDPNKKVYSVYYVLLSPFTLPALGLVQGTLLLFASLLFGAFLVIFPLVLIFARKPEILKKLLELLRRFGRWYLETNRKLFGWSLPQAGKTGGRSKIPVPS
jgi:hypothetical protein